MSKCKFVILVLFSSVTMGLFAQTTTLPAMKTAFVLNAGISEYKNPSLGFTVARIGPFGYYASFLMGIDQIHLNYDYRAAADGSLLNGEWAGLLPFYSGKRAVNRFSVTAGGMCRMVIPLHVYLGAGYGFRTETRELLNRKWVEAATSLGHSGLIEAGLIGQIESITLQAGYTLFIGRDRRLYHEAKVGIGYTFNK